MNTPFWNAFWLMFIFIPLLLIWGFALIDIFRRDDMGGVHKALWVLIVVIIPFFGTFIYLITRPAGATQDERVAIDEANREFVQTYAPTNTADQLQVLAELHDRGKLTDAEFTAEKARLLQTAGGAANQTASPNATIPTA